MRFSPVKTTDLDSLTETVPSFPLCFTSPSIYQAGHLLTFKRTPLLSEYHRRRVFLVKSFHFCFSSLPLHISATSGYPLSSSHFSSTIRAMHRALSLTARNLCFWKTARLSRVVPVGY